MATLIDMPKLSDTMTVGTLVRWLKNEGDAVANGDMIAEVETDKATMEVECFDDGVLIKQYCGEGDEVAVGDPIAAVGEAGEEAPAGTSSAPAAAPEAPARTRASCRSTRSSLQPRQSLKHRASCPQRPLQQQPADADQSLSTC